MTQNPRRPGFRLRWGEADRPDRPGSEASVETEAVAAQATTDRPADPISAEQPSTEVEPAATTDAAAEPTTEAVPPTPAPDQPTGAAGSDAGAEPDANPLLRDLVGAMRGVAESSRDVSLETLRKAVDERIAELNAGAAERAHDLRRRADMDINGVAEWERAELERVRREAEQRRQERRDQLEQELADHQAAANAEVEATRARLEQHEKELAAFFTQLSQINDPAAFVAAAKRMPAPPDLTRPGASSAAADEAAATGEATATQPTNGAAPGSPPTDSALSERLAQLDESLATTTPEEDAPDAAPDAASYAAPASTPQPSAPAGQAPGGTASAATAVEVSTPIIVKGLGSFGAITSFKQALERVDGVRGVTLSLGPTGDFVYRASHAADFNIVGAIQSIEGPAAAIEQTAEGSVRVTIERPR